MNLPEADAEYYQREFEAGHPVLIIMTSVKDRQEQATDILQQHGGYQTDAHIAQTRS